jgi:hypothetical protein
MLKTLLRRLLPFFVRSMVSLLISEKGSGVRPVRISFTLKDAHVLVLLSPGLDSQSIHEVLRSILGSPGIILTVSPHLGGALRGKLEKLLA